MHRFALAAAATVAGAASPPAQAVYDFNNLNGSNAHPFIPLDGQDGWSEQTYNAANRCGVTASLSHDGTQCLRFQEVGPGFGCDASRLGDARWRYGFGGAETSAYFMADIQVGYWGGSFGLAFDRNGDGIVRGSQAGERGVRFTVGTQANVQLQLNAADGTRLQVPLAGLAAGGDWVRIRVAMDFTAGGRTGRGWLDLRNLTAGATHFTAVAGLQGVPLGLDLMAADATNPALWNALWLHFEGATYGLDNIEVGSGLARAEEYGTGCGSPALGLRGRDRPVIGATASAETHAIPANSVAGFVLLGAAPIDPGIDLTAIGMPGCRLQVVSALVLPFTPAGSTAILPVPIPNTPRPLVGRSVYLQSLAAAPGANSLGLVAANGLRWIFDLR